MRGALPKAFRSSGCTRIRLTTDKVAYDQKTRPWQQVDRMFYDAMRCSGVGPIEAKTFYYALYRHGRHWKFKKKPEESRETALNPAEVDAIQQWIRQTNPTLDQIDSRAASR